MAYSYLLRPGYSSRKLLIEFTDGPEESAFFSDLLQALEPLAVQAEDLEDLWMNDELLHHLDSRLGKSLYSIDNWGSGFLIADENQAFILAADQLLYKHPKFEKGVANFADYA